MRPILLPGAAGPAPASKSSAGPVQPDTVPAPPVAAGVPPPAAVAGGAATAALPPPEPLLGLDAAIARVPEDLRQQMEDLLRAHFRLVQRWSPPVEPVSVRRGSAAEPAVAPDDLAEPA